MTTDMVGSRLSVGQRAVSTFLLLDEQTEYSLATPGSMSLVAISMFQYLHSNMLVCSVVQEVEALKPLMII